MNEIFLYMIELLLNLTHKKRLHRRNLSRVGLDFNVRGKYWEIEISVASFCERPD